MNITQHRMKTGKTLLTDEQLAEKEKVNYCRKRRNCEANDDDNKYPKHVVAETLNFLFSPNAFGCLELSHFTYLETRQLIW